jgi:hypothetical protein
MQDRIRWQALVRNTSSQTQSRRWHIEWTANGKLEQTADTDVTTLPKQILTLNGEVPPQAENARLVMTSDDFDLDDQVPLLRPVEPPFGVKMQLSQEDARLMQPMLAAALPDLTPGRADVTVAEIGDVTVGDALFLLPRAPADAKLDLQPVAAENHPLVKDLNWSGLLTASPAGAPLLEADTPLLWRGGKQLAFERRTQAEDGTRVVQLFLNWDLFSSNAARVPAVPVLLHRWLSARRQAQVGLRAGNYETHQRLALALPQKWEVRNLKLTEPGRAPVAFTGSVPERPGFFKIRAPDGTVIIDGATHFADAREGEFPAHAAVDTTADIASRAAERETQGDTLTPLWALLVLGCCMTAWAWPKRG